MKNPKWANIPAELRELPQWVYWRLEQRSGKNTKIPYNPKSGHPASTTDPNTWSTFDQAVLSSVNGSGIGFVFKEGGGYVGLDIDHNEGPELISWFDTYAERSQSGKGVHIIMKGELPKRFEDDAAGAGRRCGIYELYSQKRYFVFTGDVVHPEPIKVCQDKLDQFILEVFPAPQDFKKAVDLSAFTSVPAAPSILDRIRNSAQADKFNTLWAGEWQHAYTSQSDADMALLAILRFWTGGSQAESFALFRQSGLMRQKAERPDYLTRTWAKVDHGEIYTAVEPVPAEFMRVKHQQTPPWREVTIAHVKAAIEGTILEPMVKALCSPTDPPLPIEVGLAKALALCGCALAGKSEKPSLSSFVGRGGDMSRIRIMTAGGQTPNFWTLLVGESASGKDIGGLADKAALQFKWHMGSAGSEEGIADAYINKPVGLLMISEMMNWLDPRHWQSRAAGFLTHAFNKGWFVHSMSKRGEGHTRESMYCFPNICASVQPGILQDYATKSQVDSGFLGRFLVLTMPEFYACPGRGNLDSKVEVVVDTLKMLNAKEGWVDVPEKYSTPLCEMFMSRRALPFATWSRLSNEYYPRFALLLSIQPGDISATVAFTNEGWRRAEVLVKYFFAQAETVFANLHFDPIQSKFESLCKRIESAIASAPNKEMSKSEIGWKYSRGTKAKDRDEALKELIDRGLIAQMPAEKTGGRSGIRYKAV